MKKNIGIILTLLAYIYFFHTYDRNFLFWNVNYPFLKFSLNLNYVVAPLLLKIAVGIFIFKKLLISFLGNYEILRFVGYLRPLEKCELSAEETFFEYVNTIPEKKYRDDIEILSTDDVSIGLVDANNRQVLLSQPKHIKNCPMSIATNIHEFFHYKAIFQMGWFSHLCRLGRWIYSFIIDRAIFMCLFGANWVLFILFMNRNNKSIWIYQFAFYIILSGYGLIVLNHMITAGKELLNNILSIKAINKRDDLTKKEKKSCRNYLGLCQMTYTNEFLFHAFIVGYFLIKSQTLFMIVK